MVSPASRYSQARHDAVFHVQVELTVIPSSADTPCEISVCAQVVQIFRAGKPLNPGDTVNFGVAVNRRGNEFPAGGTLLIGQRLRRRMPVLQEAIHGRGRLVILAGLA